MSEYLNACEAYLGTPSGKVSERRGASASPTPPSSRVKSAGGSSSTARRRRSAGVLVKAPSPVAEIPSKPLIKSARSRRRKKLGEDISTSNSDSDYSVPDSVDSMPSRRSSSDSSAAKPRRGRSCKATGNGTPPPNNKTKSDKNSSAVKTKKDSSNDKEKGDKSDSADRKKTNGTAVKEESEEKEDFIDLHAEDACRLCDKELTKELKKDRDALLRHYTTAHYKTSLEAELKVDNTCAICKARKQKYMFNTKKELMFHLAKFHNRIAHFLSDELDVPVKSSKPVVKVGKSKKRSKRSGRKENSGSPEVIDLDDSSKTSKDEDIQMVDTNGKSGDNSGCESAASGSKSKNRKKNKKKSSKKKKAKNAQKTENNDEKDSEPDIVDDVNSDEKNGDDNSDDNGEENDELDDEPHVGLAANRSRRSTAGANNKRDSVEAAAVSTACKTKESTPAVTDDEASSEDEAKKEDSSKERLKGPFQCKICNNKSPNLSVIKRHGIDKHFSSKIKSDYKLPNSKPFNCTREKCKFSTESLPLLLRHVGIKHAAIDKYMSQYVVGWDTANSSTNKTKSSKNCSNNKSSTSESSSSKEQWLTKKISIKAGKAESWVVNSAKLEASANSTAANSPAAAAGDEDNSDDEVVSVEDGKNAENDDSASVVSVASGSSSAESQGSKESKQSRGRGRASVDKPKNMEEFRRMLKDNLRTKDGAYCKAKDEYSIECVCGKIVRVCNKFYWRYMVQKPKVINGKIHAKGHWYVCDEVKKRGNLYDLSKDEREELEKELKRQLKYKKSGESDRDTPETTRKAKSTREREPDKDFLESNEYEDQIDQLLEEHEESQAEDEEEKKRQAEIKAKIDELLKERQIGDTFLQDGPCYQVASELALCRECKLVPVQEREELILKGKFAEDTSNITCSFYAFRKLRMTRNAYLMVDGYLDPNKDPKESDIALWTPNPKEPPKNVDIAKVKYILGMIGDQFCNMVQQERKCMSLHMSNNKNITWKRPVKGVREMCDVCKTTLFNHHWICGMCGLFVCLDCYQFRRGGLVKDNDKGEIDKNTDDYKWPYCTTGSQHHINNLMLAAIIPKTCLVDLAKKVHNLRIKWDIPQFCHQQDEIKGLYAQDDGFLGLQSSVSLVNSGRNVFFPCQLCSNETFRWQFDLYKHYATRHYFDQLINMMGVDRKSPYRCPWPACNLAVQTLNQLAIHYGLNHKAVAKLLDQNKIGNSKVVESVPGIRSDMMALPATYRCPICGATLPSKHRTDHLTVHFKDKMSPMLAKGFPFSCPRCRYVAMERTSLIRHFATRHGVVEFFLKDWLQKHNRMDELGYVPPIPQSKGRAENPDMPECRLCEEFPGFQKITDLHKHLAECHFRMEIMNQLPSNQSGPVKCPGDGCSKEFPTKGALVPHYGVEHKAVFRHYNRIMGFMGESANHNKSMFLNNSVSITPITTPMRNVTYSGRGRGSYGGRGGATRHSSSSQPCLVCDEQVTPETMVFHLAHRHFQEKIAHLPKERPFKCPNCPHVNEFQGGLVKHYGNYHGIFNTILKDMGLLDARDNLAKSGIKFVRPRVEKLTGPNSNVALELARTAAIWSGNSKEEEEVLKEIAELKELERKVEAAIEKTMKGETIDKVKKELNIDQPATAALAGLDPSVTVKKEISEDGTEVKTEEKASGDDATPGEEKQDDDSNSTCLLCDHCPLLTTKSDLLRHLVEKHFRQKMYAKLIYRPSKEDKTKGTYKCPLCDFENPNQLNVARHYGVRHRFVHKLYEDIVCKPVFTPPQSKEGIIPIIPRGRPSMMAPIKEEKVQNCKICHVEHENTASYQRHLIKVHFKNRLLKDVPKLKPFICPNEGCTIERRDRFNLLMHYGGCQRKVWKVLEETPEGSVENLNDTTKTKCRLCGKFFTSPRYMWGHMADDHFQDELNSELPKESPYKCPKCPLERPYTSNDLRSLRLHYGTRHKAVMPFLAKKLDIPLDQLSREFNNEPRQNNNICQFCNKYFSTQMDYLKHSLLHIRKRVYQDLPEAEPYQCPRCPFIGGSRITLLLHYGLQHNVVAELLKEDPSTLMVDMDFIVKQENGSSLEEERISEHTHFPSPSTTTNRSAHMSIVQTERYNELDNKRFPKCKLCNYRYFTKLDLYRHFADNHLKEKLCELIGPDPGNYGPHRCPEQGCRHPDFKTRQGVWRHLGSVHGHLQRLMESEYKFSWNDWCKPMKEVDLTKAAEEKKRQLEQYQITVKQQGEANATYQDQVNQYQMDYAKHQQLVEQARYAAAQEQAETLAAHALASMAGAPSYQQRPNPYLNLPPAPTPPQPPPPLPPPPPPLRPLEDPDCLDVTVLPSLDQLDNAKTTQNMCELCGEEFTNTNKTRDKGNHQVNHFRESLLQALPPGRYDCPKCSFTGRDRNVLLKHVGLSHRVVNSAVRKEMGGIVTEVNEVTYDCKVCSQFFLNQNALNNHLIDQHYFTRLAKDIAYSSQPPFKCPKCTYEAKSHQMTVRHYGVKHNLLKEYMIADGYIPRDPTPPPPPPPAPIVQRPHASYPEVNMGKSLMNHLAGGLGGHSPYSSGYHSPRYGQSWMDHYGHSQQQPHHSQQHLRHQQQQQQPSPLRQEEVSYSCPIMNCGSTFPNATSLCKHATDLHFYERFARELPIAPPFGCPICPKTFPDQINMIRHWGVSHQMAIKIFNEQVGKPNCFDTSILKKYEIRGVREQCPLCKGSFQCRQLLLRHLADTHFKDRMCNNMPDREGLIYQCPQCPQVARDRQSFVRHYGIVHRMVIKYLNEMGIHSLDDDKTGASPSPAPSGYSHNDSFSPRHTGYPDQMGSPGYYSPHTPIQSPAYHQVDPQQSQYSSPYPSPQYKSPSYVAPSPRGAGGLTSPRTPSHASPQDLSSYRGGYSGYDHQQRYNHNQPQDLSSSQQPQDLSMSHSAPQDLSKANQPLDFSSHPSPQHQPIQPQPQYPPGAPGGQPVNLAQGGGQNQYSPLQKPLNVMVNDPYRQPPHTPGMPMTPGSQHSNPGTPAPPTPQHHTSQPGTPQSSALSPAYRPAQQQQQPPTPQSSTGNYTNPSTPQPAASYSQPATPHHPGPDYGSSVIHSNPAHLPAAGNHGVASPTYQHKPSFDASSPPPKDSNIQQPEPGVQGPFGIQCCYCDAVKGRQPSEFFRHLAETHYKDYLMKFFGPPIGPTGSLRCPVQMCPYENKDIVQAVRHLGVTHKKIKDAIGVQIVGKYVNTGPPEIRHNSNPQQMVPTSPQISVKCPIDECELEFSARYAFWQHMCDKHLKEDLLRMINHNPSTPYQCPIPGCNYTTKDSRQALVRHYGMTHKVVQTILAQKFPDFMATDKFATPTKPSASRSRSRTPVRMNSPSMDYDYAAARHHAAAAAAGGYVGGVAAHYPYQQAVASPQQSIVTYGAPSPHHQAYHHPAAGPSYHHPVAAAPAPHPQQYDTNLETVNPSDFSIPSLSEFLDNPGVSFNTGGGEDPHQAHHSAYSHHQAAPPAHHHMQFEPQIDGTFDPTSIGDQSLDGSGGASNPTTPEKNKSSMSPSRTIMTPSSVTTPTPKKYCEICGKEYEGKNRSMNKVQHMVHHFKETLYESLPPKIDGDPLPFKCPEEECKFETKHKPDWARHFGSVHKHVERLLAKYLAEHPEAWANQPGNREIMAKDSNPAKPVQQLPMSSMTIAGGNTSLVTAGVETARPSSQISGSNSDQLDSGEGLLCKIKELQQQKGNFTSTAGESKPSTSMSGRLAVELPKSDLTKFITNVLNDKNVPHAVDQGNHKKIILSTDQVSLDQKVKNVINEQQQIIDSQKGIPVKSSSGSSLLTLPQQPVPVSLIQQELKSKSVTSANIPLLTTVSTQQYVVNTTTVAPSTQQPAQQFVLTTASAPQQQEQKQEFRTVQIQLPPNLIKGHQGGTIQLQMPSGQRVQLQHAGQQQQVTQQYLKIQTPNGEQLVRVQTTPSGQLQIARQVVQVPHTSIASSVAQQQHQITTQGQQQIVVQNQPQQQQLIINGNHVQLQPAGGQSKNITHETVVVESSGRQTQLAQHQVAQIPQQQIQVQQQQQQQLLLQRLQQQKQQQQAAGHSLQQIVSNPGIAAASVQSKDAEPVIQSKIVQHNGRTYLVQFRAKKPIEPGKQIIIQSNQPGLSGSSLQEVMDEVIKQQQKQTEQQKISELAMLLQQQSQQHLEQTKQQQIVKSTTVTPSTSTTTTKLTLQQQQMLLPTEPHPQIAAQHQQKQQQLQQTVTRTSILQQQLEKGPSHSTGIIAKPSTTNNPVQCMLCIEMPWFPNQDHLENHYSSAHGIMRSTDLVESTDLEFSNADLEASLSSMHGDDAGDFETLLDALPSPEPAAAAANHDHSEHDNVGGADVPMQTSTPVFNRRKSMNTPNVGMSATRICELCGFEPKTKNKSRERMDHLAMKHFRDQMISELRKDLPMRCPRCDSFESKDRQQLFRHMISKHKVLDHYLQCAVEKMKAEGKQPFVNDLNHQQQINNGHHQVIQPQQILLQQPPTQQQLDLSQQDDQLNQIVSRAVNGTQNLQQPPPQHVVVTTSIDQQHHHITLPKFTLPSLASLSKESTPQPSTTANGHHDAGVSGHQDTGLGSQHVTLAEFMDTGGGILDSKTEKIMQVDGLDEADMEVEMIFNQAVNKHRFTIGRDEHIDVVDSLSRMSMDNEDIYMFNSQVDGLVEESDSESTNMDSEFSHGDDKYAKGKCNICGEDVKYSLIYHFAVSHFKPRLNAEMSDKRPFECPVCKEELKSKMNLHCHYLGRHKIYDEWLALCQGEEKPEWFDPNPPRGRNKYQTSTPAAGTSPRMPSTPIKSASFTTSDNEGFDELGGDLSSPLASAANVKTEWYCNLCHGGVTARREVHYASQHFKDRLRKILPVTAPFICPVCHHEHKHFLNLSTHYLTQHGFLKKWLLDQGIEYEARPRGMPVKHPAKQPEQEDTSPSKKHFLSSSDESEGEDNEKPVTDAKKSILEMSLQNFNIKMPKNSHAESAPSQATDVTVKTEPADTVDSQNASEIKDVKADVTQEQPQPEKVEEEKEKESTPSTETTYKPRKKLKTHQEFDFRRLVKSMSSEADEENRGSRLTSIMKGGKEPPPVRIMTSMILDEAGPPHMWLCDGRLLVLTDSASESNLPLFQEQWRRGQPVIVANVSTKLDMKLWHPNAFNEEFGHLEHDIINCKTHKLIPKAPLKWFWDGFENLNSRMLDQNGMPMLLKLKDWPPEEDFAQYFPKRFEDFMRCIPLPDYTRREGRFNLASYIPEFFVRPDLGPKMYIAYGSPLYPEYGSTNLHLDMSDAVNVIVYVGIPQDGSQDEHIQAGIRAVDEAGCDYATRKRVREKGVLVGALWHVYHPRDADKIRSFLNKVALEKGQKLEPHNDPIHDQSVYLDGVLRQRLFDEYGVVGYAYPQCQGDTIFIPAGAPHQVRNIHNCIKVAEDFVSPENLEWCFYQTEEFRHLTDSHTNHEDKLQIKNILYHAVKDCIAFLESYDEEQTKEPEQPVKTEGGATIV